LILISISGDFYANFSELVRTLDTDRDHVQSHTKWSQRALEWQEKEKNKDLLLRGSELNIAESWLRESEAKNKQPPATALQKEFIAKSRRQKRNNRLFQIGSAAAVFMLLSGAAIFSGLQWQQAKREKETATQLATEANIKADALLASKIVQADPVEALTRAIQVTGRSQEKLGKVLPLAQSSLSEAIQVARERNLLNLESDVNSVAITPDGSKIVSGSDDNTIRIWDIQSQSELAVLNLESSVTSVAITPDGSKIVSGSYKEIRVWDIQSQSQLAVLFGHENTVRSVAITPDGSKIVSGSGDNTIRVWDIESGSELAVLKGHESDVNSVAITPDGSKIVSGSPDKTIRVWDIQSQSELAVLFGHESGVFSVAITPDGSKIVSGSGDKTIRVWDIQSGSELAVLFGHEFAVRSVAITPDGSKIVSGSSDNTIRVWDIQSQSELAVLFGHEFPVNSVAIAPDGSRVVSGSVVTKRFESGISSHSQN
jgi:predicted NACHT family NTPase